MMIWWSCWVLSYRIVCELLISGAKYLDIILCVIVPYCVWSNINGGLNIVIISYCALSYHIVCELSLSGAKYLDYIESCVILLYHIVGELSLSGAKYYDNIVLQVILSNRVWAIFIGAKYCYNIILCDILSYRVWAIIIRGKISWWYHTVCYRIVLCAI